MAAPLRDVGAVILFVEDVQRSKGFYHDVIGLEVQFEDDHSVAFRLDGVMVLALHVDAARAQLGGEPTTTPRLGATAFLTTFTEDVDALHDELLGRGVPFFQAPRDQPWGVRTAYFKDPDGHVWEIAQAIGPAE